MKRRLLSIITALALCLSLLPATALAAEDDGYPGEEALNVQATTGSQTITVSWDALDTVNGDAVKNYTVYCYDDDDYYVEAEYTSAGSHTFDEGLTNGVTYYVGVTATYTEEGEDGPWTVNAGIEAVPLKGDERAPDAPTGVTAVTGNGSVTVSWTAPESDGGAVITGYEVRVISEELGNGASTGVQADTTTCTVDGLFGGAIYTVVVSAINAVGRAYSEPTQLEVAPAIYDLWVGGVQVTGSNLSGEGWTYDPLFSTLTLNGFTYEGAGYQNAGIYAEQDLNIVLEDENTIVSTGFYGICVKEATLAIDGTGTLDVEGSDFGIYTTEWDVGALTIGGDVTVNAVSGDVASGSSYGIRADGALTICDNAVVTAQSGSAPDRSCGIYGYTTLAICGNAKVTAAGGYSSGEGSRASGSYGVRTTDMTVTGGSLTATGSEAKYDSCGIFTQTLEGAGGSVTATGGTVTDGPSTGIGAVKSVDISDGTVIATGGDATANNDTSCGIQTSGAMTVSGGSVTAETGSGGYTRGIQADQLIVTDGDIVATAADAAVTEGEGGLAFSSGIQVSSGLTIKDGTVTAISGDAGFSYGIQVAAPAAISGGIMTAEAGDADVSYGFQAFGDITIEYANVTADGGAYGIASTGKLSVTDSEVIASGGVQAIAPDTALDLTYDSGYEWAAWTGKDKTFTQDTLSAAPAGTNFHLRFAGYDVWIGETQITAGNASDVLGDADEGATVSYDPETNTLTLNNAVIADGYAYETDRIAAIYAGSSLNLVVEGTSTVTAPDDAAISRGITIVGDLNISGSGTLTAAGGVVANTEVEINDIKGYSDSGGISVDGSLHISGCIVEAIGGSASGLRSYSNGVMVFGDEMTVTDADLTAVGGAVTVDGIYGWSYGIYTNGAVTIQDAWVDAYGGDYTATAAAADYAQSAGIYQRGLLTIGDAAVNAGGGTVTITGGIADAGIDLINQACSVGVWSRGMVLEDDAELTATGGNVSAHTANYDYAISEGAFTFFDDTVIHNAVLTAAGGTGDGEEEGVSGGFVTNYAGFQMVGPDANVTLTSGASCGEAQSSSNGICVLGGDLDLQAGMLTAASGERTNAPLGDAHAVYVQVYDEEGDPLGGNLIMAEDMTIAVPEQGRIGEFTDTATYKTIVDADGKATNLVIFESETAAYDIWVGDVRVTAENRKDVLGEADGDSSTVTYDPVTNTLTLNGANITGVDGIYASDDLNIELEGASSVTAFDAEESSYDESYGIYVRGNLNISGSGDLTVTAGAAEGDTAEGASAFSVGIFARGDLILDSGSVTAVGGTANGAEALSGGIYTRGDFILNGGSLTATGKEAEADENNLGFSTGVYTTGDFAMYDGSLTATAGSAVGAYAQSGSVFTVGDFAMYDGSLTTTGGAAVASTAEDAHAQSIGVYTGGSFAMYGGSLTATGDTAQGPSSYSIGVATKNGLDLYGGSLKTTGGSAKGDYAQSCGIETSHPEGDYLNLAVRDGYLEATGGEAVGVVGARSAGINAGYNGGLYIYGGEDGNPVVKLTGGNATVTSENEADEPYASSNGVYVNGDVEINAGDVTITGGTWEGLDGNGWAIYASADMEYDDDGNVTSITGGNVTIDCEEVTLIPATDGHGFIATKATITGVDEDTGYAILAENSITIGDTLIISNPEGGIIGTTERGAVILEGADEGASPAKSVTIELLLHKVSFVIDGLSYSSAADVPHGMSMNEAHASMIEVAGKTDFSELLNTKKDGYTFLGFYTDSGEKYDFDTPVDGDITLTAKWSGNSSSGGGSSVKTETTKNEDGSTTSTTTNKKTGEVTETTKTADGVTGTVVTDKNGNVTEVSAAVPSAAAKDAEKTGEAVTLPIEVEAADDADEAVEIDIDVPSGGAKVEIPVEDVTPGTVVVIVNKDGTEEIVKTSTVSDTGVVVTLDKDTTVKVIDNSKQFVDVHPVDHWATDAVDFVVAREIYSGTSATTFHPDNTMTRGMLAVVLHQLENTPDHNYTGSFTDVAEDSWYEDAIHWAADNGIVGGYGNGLYGPNDNITREQFAVMLWRYAGSPDSSHGLSHFVDEDQISNYARVALAWANENGIINGKGNNVLDPKGNATRAQVAQMLKNFISTL